MQPTPENPPLFGLRAQTGRWVFVAAGFLTMLCMGTAYSWSIFSDPLRARFDLSSTRVLLPFTVFLVCYALWMPLAGRWMDRVGPRVLMTLGGLMIAAGYLLAGFARGPWGVVAAYGGLAGSGVGIAYGAPLAVAARWFPEKKGLAMGITVIGFGLSPLVTAPLAFQLIQRFGLMPTFRLLGVGFGLILLLVARILRFPPPAPSAPRADAPAAAAPSPLPPWRRKGFWPLWLCFAMGTFVGLSAIGISLSVAKEYAGIPPARTAGLVSLFAVFNGLGRPLFGGLTDRIRPARTAMLSFAVIVLACAGMWAFGEGRPPVYILSFCLLWMCLGGWLAIAPASTARMFPLSEYAGMYGAVFTAYGVGALLGTLCVGSLHDLLGSYRMVFLPMGALALAGFVLAAARLPRRDTDPDTPAPRS